MIHENTLLVEVPGPPAQISERRLIQRFKNGTLDFRPHALNQGFMGRLGSRSIGASSISMGAMDRGNRPLYRLDQVAQRDLIGRLG